MWIIPQHHTQIDRFYDIIDLIKKAKNNKANIVEETAEDEIIKKN